MEQNLRDGQLGGGGGRPKNHLVNSATVSLYTIRSMGLASFSHGGRSTLREVNHFAALSPSSVGDAIPRVV